MVKEDLLGSLQDLVKYCRSIGDALQADKDNFIKNDLAKIDESNQEKKILTHKLERLVRELSSLSYENKNMSFMQRVEAARNEADISTKAAFDKATEQLKEEVVRCYQHIAVNSHIVFTNINNLKETWDKLLALEPKMDSTYDDKGKV